MDKITLLVYNIDTSPLIMTTGTDEEINRVINVSYIVGVEKDNLTVIHLDKDVYDQSKNNINQLIKIMREQRDKENA